MGKDQLLPLDIPTLRHNLTHILGNSVCHLPENYCIFDLETTSTDPSTGAIWQVGLYPVLHGVPMVDPTGGESIYLRQPVDVLRQATFEIERRKAHAMEVPVGMANGSGTEYAKAETAFIMEVYANGVDPKTGIQTFVELLRTFIDNGYPLVGQNFAKFDIPFIEYHCKCLGINFTFPSERLIDTGMLIKSAVIRRRIGPDESVKSFYLRIANERSRGVFYALERFCIPYWELDKNYGVDTTRAHSAGYDCFVTSLVLQSMMADVLREDQVMTLKKG